MVSMPSISGIMMSISTMSIAGSVCEHFDRIAAVVGRDDDHAVFLQHAWSAQRCCACRRRRSALSCPAATPRHRAWLRRHAARVSGITAAARCSRSADCVEQPLERSRLAHDGEAAASALASSLAGSRRRSRAARRAAGTQAGALLDRIEQCPRAEIGRCRHRSPGSRIGLRRSADRAPRRRRPRHFDVALDAGLDRSDRSCAASASRRAASCVARSTNSMQLGQRLVHGVLAIAAAWRGTRSRPACSARSRASSVETTHTGMCRVAGSFFSRSSTRQPSMSGRRMSSVIAIGWYSRASASAAAPCVRDQALEAVFARRFQQDPGEREVVLDDQQHRSPG